MCLGAPKIRMHLLICMILYFYNTVLATDLSPVELGLESHPNWNLLPHDICGQTAFNVTTQSQSSSLASFGQFPWNAFLFGTDKSRRETENSHKCGGVIINNNYVLTTADCCGRITVEQSRVRIGGFTFSHVDPDCTSKGFANPVKDLEIEEILNFPSSRPSHFPDHTCLVRLKHRIEFNDFVRPICLPVYKNIIQSIVEGDELQYAELQGSGSKLQKITGPLISENDCNNFYPRIQYKDFCVEFTNPKNDLQMNGCPNNAGNAVMKSCLVEGTTKTYVIGLYAHFNIILICMNERPQLFTNVTEYNRWILDNLKNN